MIFTDDSRVLLVQGCPERPHHEARALCYGFYYSANYYQTPVRRSLAMSLRYERAMGGAIEGYFLRALHT
jgi:hypothetical protein